MFQQVRTDKYVGTTRCSLLAKCSKRQGKKVPDTDSHWEPVQRYKRCRVFVFLQRAEVSRSVSFIQTKKKKATYFRVYADASLFLVCTDVSVLLCADLSRRRTGNSADMAPKGSNKQQSEEDLLLQDFSRNLSAKSTALFYGNALIVSAIPIWLFWRIWHMDLVQSAVLYAVMTLVSTYLVAFAYKNVKFVLKHKVAQKREDAVSKEVTRKLSEADNRRMSRKEKDERILWKKNEVADYEATTFSIFYNNTLFLVLVIIASFFLLKNFNPTVYPFNHLLLGTDYIWVQSETTFCPSALPQDSSLCCLLAPTGLTSRHSKMEKSPPNTIRPKSSMLTDSK
ncbi:Translocon-associated protein subunit gamma [Channa argus]|uniref:Translocon-associated protein subunit gamma n=1 Tax=Channa argus TaxID=215402 RepID=A0A6G1PRM2_CHAAH|nr:Translocon-associated protein subunit gamma [Channa argus]